MKVFLRGFLLSLVLIVVLGGGLSGRVVELHARVTAVKLAAGCELWLIDAPAGQDTTALLACPGRSLLRVWPWPPASPWRADPNDWRHPQRWILG